MYERQRTEASMPLTISETKCAYAFVRRSDPRAFDAPYLELDGLSVPAYMSSVHEALMHALMLRGAEPTSRISGMMSTTSALWWAQWRLSTI